MADLSEIKSAVVIARLLGAEGFNEHVAQAVYHYSKNRVMTERQHKAYMRLKSALAEMCKEMDAGDRLIIGKFIAAQHRMAFDAGLRVGLAAFAALYAEDV